MTVPCLRPDDLTFEHLTAIVLENPDGTEARYDCRVEFSVAADDATYIRQVDVWCGHPEHGKWQDCRRVEERGIADRLHEKADEIDLFDTVSTEVEDRRAEQKRHEHELRIDNADDRAHALRERMAERAR